MPAAPDASDLGGLDFGWRGWYYSIQRVCCGSAGFRVETGHQSDPRHRATSAHGRLTHDGGRTQEPPGSMVRGGSLVSGAATCGVDSHGSLWWGPRRPRRRWPLRHAPIDFVWHPRISWTVELCNDTFRRHTGLDPKDRPIACTACDFCGWTPRAARAAHTARSQQSLSDDEHSQNRPFHEHQRDEQQRSQTTDREERDRPGQDDNEAASTQARRSVPHA